MFIDLLNDVEVGRTSEIDIAIANPISCRINNALSHGGAS